MALYPKTAVIAAAGTESAAVDLSSFTPDDGRLCGVRFPATIVGSAMTFKASLDGTNYVTVKEVGGAANYSITMTASSYIPIDPRVFAGVSYIKVVSNVAETTGLTVDLAIRPLS